MDRLREILKGYIEEQLANIIALVENKGTVCLIIC